MKSSIAKVALIGCGELGSSILDAMLRGSIVAPADLLVLVKGKVQEASLSKRYGITVAAAIPDNIAEFGLVLIAVRPQEFEILARDLCGKLASQQVVLSLMAGVKLAKISQQLGGHKKLARAMPNLAVKVKRGATVLFCSPEVAEHESQKLQEIFKGLGLCLQVLDEDLVDRVIGVSASGTGFFFYLLQAWLEVCEELGFSAADAKKIVSQTVLGATEFWLHEGKQVSHLTKMVAVKGGTTEAGLLELEAGKLAETWKKAIRRAYARARELNA